MMSNNVKISVLTSLYNCEIFIRGYLEALTKINGKEIIEVLLLHNEPKDKEVEIINRFLPDMNFVRHIVIPERETLYRTWNRGIELSHGEYITVWNVDDVRFPSSILQQAEALDKNPEAAVSYGDIWVSKEYGVKGDFCTNSPEDNKNKEFFRQYHISCFQMWRKSIHQTVGYYDEQLHCVADFDFQMRAAIHFPFVKIAEPLGIYLEDQPCKLSANGLQDFERNIVYLRYGAYQHLNLFLLPQSNKRYKKNQMLFFDEWHNLEESALFNKWYRTFGFFRAVFSSIYWKCRQIAKKIIYPNGKS
jgi:hypothetical protein